jgi:hypothetical protein
MDPALTAKDAQIQAMARYAEKLSVSLDGANLEITNMKVSNKILTYFLFPLLSFLFPSSCSFPCSSHTVCYLLSNHFSYLSSSFSSFSSFFLPYIVSK